MPNTHKNSSFIAVIFILSKKINLKAPAIHKCSFANSEITNIQSKGWDDLQGEGIVLKMICLDIWRQWYINIQAHFQWTNCPSYPIRWRELEADCCWFTFVLLWHVPYMQDTRCSSAKRLISATINVRSLEHSLMRNVTSCLLVIPVHMGSPILQALCVTNTTPFLHILL